MYLCLKFHSTLLVRDIHQLALVKQVGQPAVGHRCPCLRACVFAKMAIDLFSAPSPNKSVFNLIAIRFFLKQS